MRKCYLHIGPPKSGTTTIQAALQDRARLFRMHGVFVPESGSLKSGSHYTLAHALAGTANRTREQARCERDFAMELDEFPDVPVVISSEYFWRYLARPRIGDRIVGKLKRLGLDVSLVFYPRNQPQSLNSSYAQGIKGMRECRPFEPFLREALDGGAGFLYGRWLAIAERLRVGLIARPFTHGMLQKGLMRDFLAAIDARSPDGAAPDLNLNPSLGPFWIDVLRRAVAAAGADMLSLDARQEGRRLLGEMMHSRSVVEPPYCGLTTSAATRIEDRFRDDNGEFSRAVWGRPWRNVFEADLGRDIACNDYDITGIPEHLAEFHRTAVGRITRGLDRLTTKDSARLTVGSPRPDANRAGARGRGETGDETPRLCPPLDGRSMTALLRSIGKAARQAGKAARKSIRGEPEQAMNRRLPLHADNFPLVLMFSQKAGCTTLAKWFLHHTGRLEEALSYNAWVHLYRTEVLIRQAGYKREAARLAKSLERPFVKLVRNPYDRAVSSFLHTLQHVERASGKRWEIRLIEDARRRAGKTIGDVPALSFLDFMRHVAATGASLDEINGHIAKQFLPWERDVTPRIIRLEQFEEEIRKLEEEFGLAPAPIERIGSSAHHKRGRTSSGVEPGSAAAREFTREEAVAKQVPSYAAFFDEETRAMVRKAFADDFKAYGYPD